MHRVDRGLGCMKKVRALVVCVVVWVCMGIMCFADDNAVSSLRVGNSAALIIQKDIGNDLASAATKGTGSNNRAAGSGSIITASGDTIYFHSDKYMAMSRENREAYMSALLSGIKSNGDLGTMVKNKTYNFILGQDEEITQALKYLTEDTSADLAKARKWFLPFTGGISTVMGVFSIVVFLFLGVSIFWDVAYLALPGLQLFLERGDDRRKPFGVSAEAWRVNREIANDYHNSKNEVSTYLKARIPVIFACAVCIAYLISGKIYEILGYVAGAFS